MPEVPSVQPPQQILELIGRPYKKRDEILAASLRLVDYSYSLQNCSESELEGLQSKIYKEVNKIISDVNELSPLLENPGIVGLIAEIEMMLSSALEHLTLDPESKTFPSHIIRTLLCPVANGTRLRLTPKTIKRAFGITVSPRDIKLLFEHQRENY
jgi:hypothetical protein